MEFSETPFTDIESALEYTQLLLAAAGEARKHLESELGALPASGPERSREAMQLVSYKLHALSTHLSASHRLLNDLRMLRRLLLQERVPAQACDRRAV
jgi:hypothetical protein